MSITQLTPIERLQTFLRLHHADVNIHRVRLSHRPGYIIVQNKEGEQVQEIDIRGVGYPQKVNGRAISICRLWQELHSHFSEYVQVDRVKNGAPTKINWQGRSYILDHKSTYTPNKKK